MLKQSENQNINFDIPIYFNIYNLWVWFFLMFFFSFWIHIQYSNRGYAFADTIQCKSLPECHWSHSLSSFVRVHVTRKNISELPIQRGQSSLIVNYSKVYGDILSLIIIISNIYCVFINVNWYVRCTTKSMKTDPVKLWWFHNKGPKSPLSPEAISQKWNSLKRFLKKGKNWRVQNIVMSISR